MFDLEKMNDLSFDKVPVFDLLSGCLTKVDRTADQSCLEMDVPTQSDIIEYRGTLEELNLLERPRDSHSCPMIGFQFSDLFSFEIDSAFLRMVKAIDAVQQDRFSSAVGTNDRENLAFFDCKTYIQQGLDTSEGHMDFFDLQ
jgi:hypothetical protein